MVLPTSAPRDLTFWGCKSSTNSPDIHLCMFMILWKKFPPWRCWTNPVEMQFSAESDFLAAMQTSSCSVWTGIERPSAAGGGGGRTWLIVFLKSPNMHVDQMYKLPWAFENPRQLKQTFWSLLLKIGSRHPRMPQVAYPDILAHVSIQSCRDVAAKTVVQHPEL